MKRLLVVVALLTAVLAPVPSVADEKSVSDPDDSIGRLDIAAFTVGHSRATGGFGGHPVSHTVSFYESVTFDEETAGALRLHFSLSRDRSKTITVWVNPDESLNAEITTRGSRLYGYARAFMVDDSTVAIVSTRSGLGRDLGRSYGVRAVTSYTRAEPCDDGGDIVGHCHDGTAPLRHRF